jgi:hypothetical protein
MRADTHRVPLGLIPSFLLQYEWVKKTPDDRHGEKRLNAQWCMTQPGVEPGYSTVMLESLDEMKADAHLVQPGLVSCTSVAV